MQRKTHSIDTPLVSISVYHTWLRLCTKSWDVWQRPLLVKTTVSGLLRFLAPFQCHSNQRNMRSRQQLYFITLFEGTVVRVFMKLQFPLPRIQVLRGARWRRREKKSAWYLLHTHARLAVEFHRGRFPSYMSVLHYQRSLPSWLPQSRLTKPSCLPSSISPVHHCAEQWYHVLQDMILAAQPTRRMFHCDICGYTTSNN